MKAMMFLCDKERPTRSLYDDKIDSSFHDDRGWNSGEW